MPVGPGVVVEFESGKGTEGSEGRLVEPPVPTLEVLGVIAEPVGATVEL